MGSDKLVARLRQLELRITAGANEACGQAADRIEALTAQLAEARESERAAVVTFIRGDDPHDEDPFGIHTDLADAIEAREHLT